MTTERPALEALSNPRSDRVKAVARLSGRSARQRAGRFLAEGPQAVREAVTEHAANHSDDGRRRTVDAPGALRELYATPEAAARYPEIIDQAIDSGIWARLVTDEVLEAMLAGAGSTTPQGLLAVCDLITVPFETVLEQQPRLVAVLSQVRDPGNAGTVIRAADAAGADAVVLTESSVDVHNPKCVRSTAGSLFHLPVVTGVPLADAVQALKAQGITVLAADGVGEHDLDVLGDDAEDRANATTDSSTPARSVPTTSKSSPYLENPVAWVFGNEAWGLPETDRELADAVVRVPVHGRAESLNLGTAATVCLYATARAQRRQERRFTKADPAAG
ncbi:TrmH family RNA methyltransferase [Kineosporia babensis]|uniref:RNA methyltransferase n=1 Tax=Kineosporia babensis TaxID=499548 RepID=A0A9X1NCW3_9ACTN|nr:RNA methyltransferase [Kineosporia babensis]MCD5311446.1 RNA methyltransferase [Kineosporia babensis]